MKKIIFFILLAGAGLFQSCNAGDPVLPPSDYTIVDTTHIGRNGYGSIMSYDVIILNHHDSLYYAGQLSRNGRLTELNFKPLKLTK